MFMCRKFNVWVFVAVVSGSFILCYLFASESQTYFLVKEMSKGQECKSGTFKEHPIFLVETSGSPILNSRQACAVESAARHNPSMVVYVLMTSKTISNDHNLMKTLTGLQNVNIIIIDMEAFLQDSPLFLWYYQGRWRRSKWKVSHMSDALRFFLLWKYGGTYLDMDTVTLRSFEKLKNVAIKEDRWIVASGILLNFDKRHEVMKRCLYDIIVNYNPNTFGANGPHLFTRNILKFCHVNIKNIIMQNFHSIHYPAECGINIISREAAYPIHYVYWKKYFLETTVENVADTFNSSYIIHVWNTLSKDHRLQLGGRSLYELAFKQHCPLVYEYATNIGYV